MIERYYSHPTAVRRFREGPLGSYIDAFARDLYEQGYARFTARYEIRLVAKFSKWLERRKLTLDDLSEKRVDEFILGRNGSRHLRYGEAATLHRLLGQLRAGGVIHLRAAKAKISALDRMERAFEKYLYEERRLADQTVKRYLPFVRLLLCERFGGGPLKCSALRAKDVIDFVLRHAQDHSLSSARLMVTALRSFLRFLRMRGKIVTDLTACVPTVADWRLATLPKSLEPGQVEKVLEHCNRQSLIGQRDYAILLLLARLGLRAGEVVALTLEDIHWEAGEITIRGKGSQQQRLPLPNDVGKALVSYLQNGRPHCSCRQVFIRSRAPLRGFASSVAISTIVSRALIRAGLTPPRKGAHLFRHSVASHMLCNGASLHEIGEILRHQNLNTTAIYAKVDLIKLRALTQPWPGGES